MTRARPIAILVLTWLLYAPWFVASPVAASTSVLCYGDSITAGLYAPGYPLRLQHLRSDLVVTNGGKSGDTSFHIERLAGYLAAASYDYVVILIGINDYAISTPQRTTLYLQKLINIARDAGSNVVILTLLPRTCGPSAGDCSGVGAQIAFGAGVSSLILSRMTGQTSVTVGDLRTAIGTTNWGRWSSDGLHPTVAGAVQIARFVSTLLP